MSQESLKKAGDDGTINQESIAAFFNDAREGAAFLCALHANGRAPEAFTLCLVYIDSFSQWLFWPRDRTGQNFVEALVDYGGDPDFGLIHPLAVTRAFGAMKDHWKDFGARLHGLFPGPAYSLYGRSEFFTEIAGAFTSQETKLLEAELWRGTIANIAYTRLRNPSVHNFRRAAKLSFDNTTYQGQPARALTFGRLHQALLGLVGEAESRSIANNQWFGNDRIVKGA